MTFRFLDRHLQVVHSISGFEPRDQLGSELDVTFGLWQRGLVSLLLTLLKALPPISKRPAPQPDGLQGALLLVLMMSRACAATRKSRILLAGGSTANRICDADWQISLAAEEQMAADTPSSSSQDARVPKQTLYRGYRSDVVAGAGSGQPCK